MESEEAPKAATVDAAMTVDDVVAEVDALRSCGWPLWLAALGLVLLAALECAP